jgi:hypothetical protein
VETIDIVLIAIFAALWSVLDFTLAPIFFAATHTPILCDAITLTMLMMPLWIVRKLGTATLVASITFVLHMTLRPSYWFAAWIATGVVVDLSTRLFGYDRCFSHGFSSYLMTITLFTLGALVGGFLIGTTMFSELEGVILWAGYHGIGGMFGSIIGLTFVKALEKRGIVQTTL